MLLIEKSKPKRTRESESAIVRRAAPETNDDFLRTTRRRVENHFTNAERVRQIDILFVGAQSPHARGLAHLNHRQFTRVDVSVTRFDLASEWIVRFTCQPRAAERIANHLDRSVATIGEWHDVDLGVRQNFAQTSGDIFRDFTRGQRAFEFIRRN